MHLACKTRFTDRVWFCFRVQSHACNKTLINQPLDSIIVMMSKSAMPKIIVKWDGCSKANMFLYSSCSIQIGNVVLPNRSNKDLLASMNEIHMICINMHIIISATSKEHNSQ